MDKSFFLILGALGTLGLSLFVIFKFVSMAQSGVTLGFILFLAVSVLLILGYMFGMVALGFVAFFVLTRIWWRRKIAAKSAE